MVASLPRIAAQRCSAETYNGRRCSQTGEPADRNGRRAFFCGIHPGAWDKVPEDGQYFARRAK